MEGSVDMAFALLVGFFLIVGATGSVPLSGGFVVVAGALVVFFLVGALVTFMAGGRVSIFSSVGTRAILLVTTVTAAVTSETLDVTDTEMWDSGGLEGAGGEGRDRLAVSVSPLFSAANRSLNSLSSAL